MGQDASSGTLLGQVLGGAYRIERLLGEGGMGAVYEASHTRIPRRFAIKVLHRRAVPSKEAMARFEREAMVVSKLGHDNIVEVIDFNRATDGSPYIVMELLQGKSLAVVLNQAGRLPLNRALTIGHQVLAALVAAHRQSVVHRDLKPENIFVCPREHDVELAKVLDFGISKVLDSQSIVTRDTAVFGTPWYMPPEQAEGRVPEIDHRTDLFSMGVILYHMLSGKRPFTGPNVPAVLYQIVHSTPRQLCAACPDIPREIAEVVHRAMRKRPLDRFQSAEEMRDALTRAAGAPLAASLGWQMPEPLSEDPSPAFSGETRTMQGLGTVQATAAQGPSGDTGPPERKPTTLSASAGELSVLTAEQPTGRTRWLIAAGIALAGIVGAWLLIRSPGEGQGPTRTPGEQPKLSAAAAPPPDSGQTSEADAAIVRHTVGVKADPKTECIGRIADAKPQRQTAPCSFTVPDGTLFRIEILHRGYRSLQDQWVVRSDREIAIRLQRKTRRVVARRRRRPRRGRPARIRRPRHRQASAKKAPPAAGAKQPEAKKPADTKPKKPKYLGEGVDTSW